MKLQKISGFHYEYDEKTIKMPRDVASILRHYLMHFCSTDRENFIVMFLNTKNRIAGISTAHVGSLDASIVHPREVFTEALLHKAASIIVCHNHPSGDPTPSREDIAVTQTLREAGQLLGVDVLDHIILGEDDRYCSLKEGGYM